MRFFTVIFLIFFINCAYGAEFGEYQYSKYLGIQQQLQNQRMLAIRRNMRYYKNPTRNIQYPSANNPYPNIQRNSYRSVSARERYSPNYYRMYYWLEHLTFAILIKAMPYFIRFKCKNKRRVVLWKYTP